MSSKLASVNICLAGGDVTATPRGQFGFTIQSSVELVWRDGDDVVRT